MGLLDRLQNGIAAGAETASEAFMTQFKSQVEQERQEALIRAQESSRIRTAEAEAGIQLNTRQKSFEQDEANAGLLRARKVADETEVGTARNALERGAAKNKMADDLAFKKTNAKGTWYAVAAKASGRVPEDLVNQIRLAYPGDDEE